MTDPVVAEVGTVRLRWHARSLRGSRTIVDAARLVGLNRDELARIERGETKQIRFQTVAKLLAGYGCALTDLFEVEAATPEEGPIPLYAHAIAALAQDGIPLQPVRRRAVRRSVGPDVTGGGGLRAAGFELYPRRCTHPAPPLCRRHAESVSGPAAGDGGIAEHPGSMTQLVGC